MNDVRDEALGALLDGAALGIESMPVDRLPEALQRGDRRRVLRFTAIGAALAVFTGGITWAGVMWTGDVQRNPAAPRMYSSAEAPWTFEFPSDWTARTIQRAAPELIANVTRTTVVNGPTPPHAGAYGPNSGGNDALTSEVGDSGVLVLVERFWNGAAAVAADDYRVDGPGEFVDDAQSPGWTFRERTRCDGTLCFNVVEWLGPSASSLDRDEAAEIARSVRLADVDRWLESDRVNATLHDEVSRYTVTYPSDWVVADENLTPWLSSPSEVLSLGTFPLRVSEHPDDGFRLFDAPVAPAALQDMQSDDAFISLQESTAVFAGSTEDRPDHFGPLGCDDSIYGCRPSEELPEAWRDLPFRAWWIPFKDAGRAFYLFVAIGTDATPQLRQQAWTVADSLSFEPDPS